MLGLNKIYENYEFQFKISKISGSSAAVEHYLAKVRVGSSNLLFRSITFKLKFLRFPLSISYENNTLTPTEGKKWHFVASVASATLPNIYNSNNW